MKNLNYNGEEENKSSFLSILLITLLISGFFMVWSLFFAPKNSPKSSGQKQVTNIEKTNQSGSHQSDFNNQKTLEGNNSAQKYSNKKSSFNPTEVKTIFISNKNMKIGFSTKGAVIIDSRVRIYGDLFSGNLEEKSILHQTGETHFKKSNNLDLTKEEKNYSIQKKGKDFVTFWYFSEAENLIYEKKYQLQENYQVKLKVNVFKKADGKVVKENHSIQNILLVNGSNIGQTNQESNSAFDQVMLSKFYNDEMEETLKVGFLAIFSKPKPVEREINEFPLRWISLDNRFFARILKAPNNQKTLFIRKAKADNTYDYIAAQQFSAKNEVNATFYYLPKSRNLMDTFYRQTKDEFFHLFHQYNITRILSTIMYKLLMFINSVIDNFGWSIILLTIIVKLMVLPLTNKSMKSMKKMAELAPQINAIKQQNKKNPQKVQLETMALYKKNKVNPISGCLPILLTIPIFISLYSLFQNMVELQRQSFYWIEDLAVSESIFQFSFSLPLMGDKIHLLPIVMTVTSLAQGLLTPSQKPIQTNNEDSIAASQQKIAGMMKYYMPVMFLFISWNMPSALVLYWSCQNIFSLIQTIIINKNNYKLTKK